MRLLRARRASFVVGDRRVCVCGPSFPCVRCARVMEGWADEEGQGGCPPRYPAPHAPSRCLFCFPSDRHFIGVKASARAIGVGEGRCARVRGGPREERGACGVLHSSTHAHTSSSRLLSTSHRHIVGSLSNRRRLFEWFTHARCRASLYDCDCFSSGRSTILPAVVVVLCGFSPPSIIRPWVPVVAARSCRVSIRT